MNLANQPPSETLWRHYNRSPLKEAILDVRIKPIATAEVFERISLADLGYPEKKKMHKGKVTVQQESAGILTTDAQHEHSGFQFISANRKFLVQFRLDGFTVTRLAPYENWEAVRDEAKKVWAVYRDAAGPSIEIIRVAVRYVNQLDLPNPIRDFRDYIRSYPEISSDLPPWLSSFFMQVQIPQVDGCMLILNEALVPPPNPNQVSVVLDLDVIKDGLSLRTDDDLWSTMEVLRVRKNLVFESCITNATRELIS